MSMTHVLGPHSCAEHPGIFLHLHHLRQRAYQRLSQGGKQIILKYAGKDATYTNLYPAIMRLSHCYKSGI
jgi:hypothetical protein